MNFQYYVRFHWNINLYSSVYSGLDKIEHLQEHSSDQIYHVAHRIIDKYFSDSEEVDSTLDPQQSQDGGQFMFNSNSRPPEGGFRL